MSSWGYVTFAAMSDFWDAECHTHCHPGPIVHYLGTEVGNTSIIQSITRTILKFQSIDSSKDYTITIIGARYIQNYVMYTVCNN